MHRSNSITLALVSAAGLFGASPAFAQDFNGDGIADIAIGAPFEDVGAFVDDGADTVIYGNAGPGLSAFVPIPSIQLLQSTFGYDLNEAGDNFGASIAWGDFNGDGFDDLAIGAPGEDAPGAGPVDCGAVYIYHGFAGGFVPAGMAIWHQGVAGEILEVGDQFGFALASGDFNADGFSDLAVGAPFEDLAFANQGLLHQIGGSPGGLFPGMVATPMFIQSAFGDPAEANDQFGQVLAAGQLDAFPGDDLAIGVPAEDFAGDGDCGMVNVCYAMPGLGLDIAAVTVPETWTQDSPGVPQATNPGDSFGHALAIGDFDGNLSEDLAIGVPLEDIGANVNAGYVNVIYSGGPVIGLDAFGPVAAEGWHQGIAGIPEVNDPNDWFGYSLASGSFNGDRFDDLAVGVPLEDVVAVTDAGYVNTIYGAGAAIGLDAFGPVAAEGWHQNSAGVPDANEASDRCGWSLTTGDYDKNGCADLAWGANGEDIAANPDSGLVNVVHGNTVPLMGLDGVFPIPAQAWTQNSAGIPDYNEPGDAWGSALDNDD